MNYFSQLIEQCRHIQEERWTVKCNRVNNYCKKTSTEIRLQGFWGSDKGGADRAQGEPQESKRRNVYLAALPCEHWEQGAAPKFTDFLWAYAPLQYIRRPVPFGNAAGEEHAAAAARRASWRYERYRHTDCDRNGKRDFRSRKRGRIGMSGLKLNRI